jgi:L-2,4-diaminobutyrate decarboxylase
LLEERLVPHLMRYDRPTFQSMFNALAEPGAALGARVALEWNQGVANWQVSPGGAVLEELCMRALAGLFGLAPTADGTCMYCGTYANEQGLYMALHRHAERRGFDFARRGLAGFEKPERLAIVTSVDAHFSIRHAVRTLGLGEESLALLEVDQNRKMNTARLRERLLELAAKRDVFAVVATAGTTSTGAVDPLETIADLVESDDIWLHVDGAYGLAYKLVPSRSELFQGIDRADSVAWDPHKQFGVPIPSSILFIRNQSDFDRMAVFSSYFNRSDASVPNPGLKSAPSTRPLAALPLVTSILHQGLRGIVDRLEAPLRAIEDFSAYLDTQPDVERCHAPDLGVLCFRFREQANGAERVDDLHRKIVDEVNRRGRRSVAITELDGETALRVVAVSPAVTTRALIETLDDLRSIAQAV